MPSVKTDEFVSMTLLVRYPPYDCARGWDQRRPHERENASTHPSPDPDPLLINVRQSHVVPASPSAPTSQSRTQKDVLSRINHISRLQLPQPIPHRHPELPPPEPRPAWINRDDDVA